MTAALHREVRLANLHFLPSGWKKDPRYVYIGRAGGGLPGVFGNPHWGKNRLRSIASFERYFLARVEEDAEFRAAVLGLHGKILVCFCHPKPCHGHIILKWLDAHPPPEHTTLDDL